MNRASGWPFHSCDPGCGSARTRGATALDAQGWHSSRPPGQGEACDRTGSTQQQARLPAVRDAEQLLGRFGVNPSQLRVVRRVGARRIPTTCRILARLVVLQVQPINDPKECPQAVPWGTQHRPLADHPGHSTRVVIDDVLQCLG